jgi:hypothetical protein
MIRTPFVLVWFFFFSFLVFTLTDGFVVDMLVRINASERRFACLRGVGRILPRTGITRFITTCTFIFVRYCLCRANTDARTFR